MAVRRTRGRRDLNALDRDAAADITRELSTLQVDGTSGIDELLAAVRGLIRSDSVVLYSLAEHLEGWRLDRFHYSSIGTGDFSRGRVSSFFAGAPRRFAWYDAGTPEPWQRNKVLDALDIIPDREYESSRIYQEWLYPAGLHRFRQPRVLICDGGSLLAWFGAFHSEPFDGRQLALLGLVAGALQRRLRIERQIELYDGMHLLLRHAFERLGAPAFAVDRAGRILEVNESGRALLDARRDETSASIRDAITSPHGEAFEVVPAAETGGALRYLVIARAPAQDRGAAAAVAAATARWRLTRRQSEVLAFLVRGTATATIAEHFGVSQRAIELHVTALLDRAGVENRTALVARVLA